MELSGVLSPRLASLVSDCRSPLSDSIVMCASVFLAICRWLSEGRFPITEPCLLATAATSSTSSAYVDLLAPAALQKHMRPKALLHAAERRALAAVDRSQGVPGISSLQFPVSGTAAKPDIEHSLNTTEVEQR